MGSINFNALTKAAFNDSFDIPKNKLSLTAQQLIRFAFIDNILDNINIIKKHQNDNNNELIVKILKDTLALCYISNIDLNNYIKVEVKDEDNSTVN